jgi:hypothetical protein
MLQACVTYKGKCSRSRLQRAWVQALLSTLQALPALPERQVIE